MKKWLRLALVLGVVALSVSTAGWGYYKHRFPYGHTHRCSKALAMFLTQYAEAHDGKYPVTNQLGSLGLSALLDQDPGALEFIVGKAGDLKQAKQFYEEHGYLKPEHSSWHYVPNLTTSDEGRALLWDKIPLGHNGQRTKRNTREVILVGGFVEIVAAEKWESFLIAQADFNGESNGANKTQQGKPR